MAARTLGHPGRLSQAFRPECEPHSRVTWEEVRNGAHIISDRQGGRRTWNARKFKICCSHGVLWDYRASVYPQKPLALARGVVT